MLAATYIDSKSFNVFLYVGIGIVLIGLIQLFRWRPRDTKAPAAVKEYWPILGAASFWTERWSFFKRAIESSSTGNFSFWAGPYHVVGLSGHESRHTFYNTKQLGIAEGYAILGGNLPSAHVDGEEGEDIWPKQEFLTYLKERVRRMLQRDVLKHRLPTLVKDTTTMLDELDTVFNPFEDIYRLIFQLIMRGVGCYDVAENRQLLDSMLSHYNNFTASATREAIIFPKLPTFSLLKRYYYGGRLFLKLQSIIQERQKLSAQGVRKYDDPLQELIDRKCGTSHTIGIILGAVFAGQQNTSVNAAWILVHLADNKTWSDKIREELRTVAQRYDPDAASNSLIDSLSHIPLEAWDKEFPAIDLCIKENLRLHGLGSQIRRNTGADIPLGKSGDIIPSQAFVAYHTADMHLDPSVYIDPLTWDPSRYLPGRAEDKKEPLAWAGWGAGRHVCLGMKLAQLQLNLIVATFLAMYDDVQLCDASGTSTSKLPEMDLETWVSEKPAGGNAYLRVRRTRGSH